MSAQDPLYVGSRTYAPSSARYDEAMLHQFLAHNRTELIERCRGKVAQRPAPQATHSELEFGIPLFLDQLIKTLRVEQTVQPKRSRAISGEAGGKKPDASEISVAAILHGRELLNHGFTIDQVVHDYGDLCQAITDLAFEVGAPIDVDEFRTLNRCLDNGIADAVTEFANQHETLITDKGVQALNERLGSLAHELRNLIQTATLAVTAIKAGNVGLGGATGAILDRSLIGLRILIEKSLADVRATAGMPARLERLCLADLISEAKISASLEARSKGCRFTVLEVERSLVIESDREMLLSAIGNLLQNAFKFTKHASEVTLTAYAVGDRVLIDIEDNCGGLPYGSLETMFLPFTQNDQNKTGLGLGLSIARRSIEANNGILSVRDVPGSGCVFTIDVPRSSTGPLTAINPKIN